MTHDQWRLIADELAGAWHRLNAAYSLAAHDTAEKAELLTALQRLEACQTEVWHMIETRTEEQ